MMKKTMNWLLAATLVGSAGVFTACTSDDDDNAAGAGTTVVEAVINETNFPDANFRRFLLEQDYGKDGTLTNAEIKSITVMNVEEEEIGSLKGIEYFTALDTLDCSGNSLTELDVSKNVALKELNCSFNGLTALDISKNPALKTLACSFNELTALDISKNLALKMLICNFNYIASLDVSKNTELEYLHCSSNQLGRLDVSKNTKLTKLYCNSNQLTTLDVSRNTALTDLDCYKNELTTLVISSNAPLSELLLYRNKISEKSMDELISSLPRNTSSEAHKFAVIDHREGDEGNVFTKSQSDAVRAKGWSPVYWEEKENKWKEFE